MGLLGLIRQKSHNEPPYGIVIASQKASFTGHMLSYDFETDRLYKLVDFYKKFHVSGVEDVNAPKVSVYSNVSKSRMIGMLKKAESRIKEEIHLSTETIAELEMNNVTDMPSLSSDMSYYDQVKREKEKQVSALYGIGLIRESLNDGRVFFVNEQNLNIEKSKFV